MGFLGRLISRGQPRPELAPSEVPLMEHPTGEFATVGGVTQAASAEDSRVSVWARRPHLDAARRSERWEAAHALGSWRGHSLSCAVTSLTLLHSGRMPVPHQSLDRREASVEKSGKAYAVARRETQIDGPARGLTVASTATTHGQAAKSTTGGGEAVPILSASRCPWTPEQKAGLAQRERAVRAARKTGK